jgi:hypothetical protein
LTRTGTTPGLAGPGLTDGELDFIINYDIKYRMGRSAGPD